MASFASNIPLKIFERILYWLLYEYRFKSSRDPTVRREEMKVLSVCASTCLYWAQSTRAHMFSQLTLRSYTDLCYLKSLLSPPLNTRVDSIGKYLWRLFALYSLGDRPWLHDIAQLKTHGASGLTWISLHINGPVPSALTLSGSQSLRPLLPLMPDMLPIPFHGLAVSLKVANMHFANPAMLFTLLQDLVHIHSGSISCENLTWDHASTVTTSSIELQMACRRTGGVAARCTDNVLVAAMVMGVSASEVPPLPQGPYLSLSDSSCLFDIMHITRGPSPDEQGAPEYFNLESCSSSDQIQKRTPTMLPEANIRSDFYLEWKCIHFGFSCIAQAFRLSGESDDVRRVSYMIVDTHFHDDMGPNRYHKAFKSLDWDAWLRALQRFPDLRGILINNRTFRKDSRRYLKKFVAQLRQRWIGVANLLEVYDYQLVDRVWTRIELDALIEDASEMDEEVQSDLNDVELFPGFGYDDYRPDSDPEDWASADY